MKRNVFGRPAFGFGFFLLVSILAPLASAQIMDLDKAAPLTLYKNGHIYTNDSGSPWATAMLVRGEIILAIGDEDEVTALSEKGAQVVDLEGHFVMPGSN